MHHSWTRGVLIHRSSHGADNHLMVYRVRDPGTWSCSIEVYGTWSIAGGKLTRTIR